MLNLTMCPLHVKATLESTLMTDSNGNNYYYCSWRGKNAKKNYTRMYETHPRKIKNRFKSGEWK
jgi:hypothetical protein